MTDYSRCLSTLVERVREQAGAMSVALHWETDMFFEAADRIEELEKENEELKYQPLQGDIYGFDNE